jgi:hypothetical protein
MACVTALVFCSAWLLAAPPAMGTNGAGVLRTWTAYDGEQSNSIRAKFVGIRHGLVMLERTIDVKIATPVSPYKPNHFRQETVQQDVPLRIPLASLSVEDRRWIEDRNPTETSLSERSKKGDVGTLSPKDGRFMVTEVDADQERAVVQYIRQGNVVWTFSLHSKLAAHLQPATPYDTISCNLIPNYERMPKNKKERYGLDFQVIEKISKGRKGHDAIDVVEDYR